MKLNNGNKYWVGDPCYVYPKKEWSKFCNTIPYDNHGNFDNFFTTTYNDIPFFVTSTAYGDGCYKLTKNGSPVVGELGVDAGLLSIIPEELIQLWGKEEEAGNLGIWVTIDDEDCEVTVVERGWVTIDEDCEVTVVERGVFSFGSYEVDTKGYQNDEDYYIADVYEEDDYR